MEKSCNWGGVGSDEIFFREGKFTYGFIEGVLEETGNPRYRLNS